MPGRRGPESAEMKAIREVDTEDSAAIDKLALQFGDPPDAEKLSEADEDEAWETQDAQVEYEAFAQQLMTQGLPPELAQSLLVVKLHPEWAPLYAQPTQDAEQADMLTRLAQYPFRLSLLEDYDDFEDQTRKAESLDQRYQKRLTAMQEQQGQMMPPEIGYGGTEE